MKSVRVSAVVGEDRRLVVELPPEIPAGPVELTIRSLLPDGESVQMPIDSEREALRSKMIEAGILSRARFAPADARPIGEEEILRAGTMPSGARPSDELIAEDREQF